jgi:hypothetical protein
MAYSYTYTSATAITTPAINSTKVIVVANVACYANINGTATPSSSVTTLVPANVRTTINMMGIGNTLSLLPAGGTAAMTVTQVGNVAPSGVAGPVTGGNTYTNG